MAGLATPMALRVAVTLGLPERLLAAETEVAELAAELDVSPAALDRLLAHLASIGVVEQTAAGYRTTEFGAHLADPDSDVLSQLHLDSAIGRADLAFVELLHTVRTGGAGYPRRYGQDFWADLAEQPQLRESFDRQMTRRFRAQVPHIVSGFDWSRFPRIVDVGGGHGTLLAAILAAHPTTSGQLVDLAPTAAEAARTFDSHGLGDRARALAGSFFDPLPAGADAYLLCDILHDWDDEHAHRILARCVEAAGSTGRILVVEAVGGRRAHSAYDLSMLVFFGGRERRTEEFRALAAVHGLALDSVVDLTDQRCLLEFRAD